MSNIIKLNLRRKDDMIVPDDKTVEDRMARIRQTIKSINEVMDSMKKYQKENNERTLKKYRLKKGS